MGKLCVSEKEAVVVIGKGCGNVKMDDNRILRIKWNGIDLTTSSNLMSEAVYNAVPPGRQVMSVNQSPSR